MEFISIYRNFILVFLIASITCANAANASEPKPLFKNASNWGAFTLKEPKGKVCYVAGQPKYSKPKGAKRGPIWILITHRPYAKTKGEVGVAAGYPFKNKSSAIINIDGVKFKLFTEKETAWIDAKTPKIEKKLVAAMQAGKMMVIRGISKRGTKTSDHYSLKGFTRAYKAINRACKVN